MSGRPAARAWRRRLGVCALAGLAVLALTAAGGVAIDPDEFDKVYNDGLDDQIEVKCFRKGDFDACLRMQQDGGGRNPAFIRQMYDIAHQDADRRHFETLLGLRQVQAVPDIWTNSKQELQAIYRRDGARNAVADDFLKAYRLGPNADDLDSFLAGASIDELHHALGDDSVRTGPYLARFQQQAVQRFLKQGGVRGYYYAFTATGDRALLQQAVAATVSGGQGIAGDVFAAYVRGFVTSLAQVPAYAALVEKCRDCDRAALYEHVAMVPGFAKSAALADFPASVEYRYYFAKLGYAVQERADGRRFHQVVTSQKTSLDLVADGRCVSDGEESESQSIGFLDVLALSLSTGGRQSPKEKLVHYQRFRCGLSAGDAAIADTVATGALSATPSRLAHGAWSTRDAVGEEIVWEDGSSFVMVEADGICMAGCAAKNLQISGGPGEFKPSFSGARAGTIYKGYQGQLAGRYRYSVQIGADICSGSFSVSGTRPNFRLRLYPQCRDAGSGEF